MRVRAAVLHSPGRELEVVEARRRRATAIAQAASESLTLVRRRVPKD